MGFKEIYKYEIAEDRADLYLYNFFSVYTGDAVIGVRRIEDTDQLNSIDNILLRCNVLSLGSMFILMLTNIVFFLYT